MKFNIDLTAADPNNLVTDELYNNVGSGAFSLDHDLFYGEAEMEIWTGAGGTGTQLIEDTDYTLGGLEDEYTARAGRDVYSTVSIINATYQSGDLYFTYQAFGDYVDAYDRYHVVRATGQSWELTSTGEFELYTSSTSASSVKIDSTGGLDIDTAEGITINDDSGASLVCTSAGVITLQSAINLATVVKATGTGTADLTTEGTGSVRVYSSGSNTNVDAVRINAAAGGIDIDSVIGINMKDTYAGASTGTGISLVTDNTSTGTGGTILLRTQASAGTAGNITLTTSGTNRLIVSAAGNATFYGGSATGALPVITLNQSDVDEPFVKLVGDAAAATPTNDLVAAADVTTPTIAGYFKIEIQDDGNQITDGDYYVPFYTLA